MNHLSIQIYLNLVYNHLKNSLYRGYHHCFAIFRIRFLCRSTIIHHMSHLFLNTFLSHENCCFKNSLNSINLLSILIFLFHASYFIYLNRYRLFHHSMRECCFGMMVRKMVSDDLVSDCVMFVD
jgi:hypothetical protein